MIRTSRNMYNIYLVHVLMRDERRKKEVMRDERRKKEVMRDERKKKEVSKVKQTRQSNTAYPRQSLFLRKMSCLMCMHMYAIYNIKFTGQTCLHCSLASQPYFSSCACALGRGTAGLQDYNALMVVLIL